MTSVISILSVKFIGCNNNNPLFIKGLVCLTCPPKTDPQVMLEWWIEGRQGDEQEAIHPGADLREAKGSRGGFGTGSDGGPGMPYPGHCRADLLSLAPGVRWFKG